METYIPRFLQLPNQHCFLFGPRGTGKSTFLRHQLPNALWIDLLKPENFRNYKARPERLEELVLANPQYPDIVIDEVQRVPELLSLVHRLVEMKLNRRFVLTGSSARKLKSADADLLGGRAVRKFMYPFMLSELPHVQELGEILDYGLLPVAYHAVDKAATLDAYISLYMQQEVYQEALVRNIGDFARFLEAVSFSHGAVMNISNVARDCGVGRKTVEGFIQILFDIMLAFQIPVFTKKASRQMSAHPKFYFFDTGVFQTLRPKGLLDSPEEIGGAALEGLVAQHLNAWIAYGNSSFNLSFWRSLRGLEVDFVLYGSEGFYAIEVKNSARIRSSDLVGLSEFGKDYPESRRILLYRGSDRLLKDGILCLPVDNFLNLLKPSEPLNMVLGV
ncbi:MAG: AAA family ATPase [Saprospiraceae bacterium]|nr:AAA family ATPase [Saprospiraceae bacterium]